MGELQYLIQELEKLAWSYDKHTEQFLKRIVVNQRQRNHIDDRVLPNIKKDIQHQELKVIREAERLLKEDENEKKQQNNPD